VPDRSRLGLPGPEKSSVLNLDQSSAVGNVELGATLGSVVPAEIKSSILRLRLC
jgi:hypothetical protein